MSSLPNGVWQRGESNTVKIDGWDDTQGLRHQFLHELGGIPGHPAHTELQGPANDGGRRGQAAALLVLQPTWPSGQILPAKESINHQ